jgi:hypothetical protein
VTKPASTPSAVVGSSEGIATRKASPIANVLLSLLPPLYLTASLGILLSLPAWPALPICAALYGIVVLAEARHGIYSPESLTLLGCFLLCAVTFRLFPGAAPFQFASIGILAVLTVLAAALVASDRPLPAFYLPSRGYRRLHDTLTRLWLVVYALGLVTSLALVAGSWFRFAPLAFVLAGTLAAMTLNLVTFGPRHRRERQFDFGGFTFREIERNDAALESFLDSYAEEIWTIISPAMRAKLSKADVLDDARRTEKAVGDPQSLYYFNAYDQGRVIAGIAVALDRPGRRLPVEDSFGVTLDPLRQFGRVMEVRRLSIDRQHRLQPDLIRGLFKCIVEVALENDVSFIADFAFASAAMVLDKVGLRILNIPGRGDVHAFGSPMRLLAMNLAALVFNPAQRVNPAASVGGLLNRYMLERYVKRLTLRQGWRPEPRRAWSLSVANIETLCVPTDFATAEPPCTPG